MRLEVYKRDPNQKCALRNASEATQPGQKAEG